MSLARSLSGAVSGSMSGAWNIFKRQNHKNQQAQARRILQEMSGPQSNYGSQNSSQNGFQFGPATPPRRAHYAMAHGYLRQAALADPVGFVDLLSSQATAEAFLHNTFTKILVDCKRPSERPDFTAKDVKARMILINGWPTILTEMPAPKARTEAFYTACVVFLDLMPEMLAKPAPRNTQARYFTLEKGFSADGLPLAVFGEWEGGKHKYHNDSKDNTFSDVEGFIRSIERMIPSGNRSATSLQSRSDAPGNLKEAA